MMIDKHILTFEPHFDGRLVHSDLSLRYWSVSKEPEYWMSQLYGVSNRGFKFYEELSLELKPVLVIL